MPKAGTTKLTPEVRVARARKAAKTRHHPGADTSEEDRALQRARTDAFISQLVSEAPELNEDQRARLRALLAPTGGR